ncbi:hypothetical protein D3C75_903230 [compost metagenome]
MLRRIRVRPECGAAIMQQHHFARIQLGKQLFGQPVCAELLLPVAEHCRPQHDLHLAALRKVEQINDPPGRAVISAPFTGNTENNIISALYLAFDGSRTHQPVRLVNVIMDSDQMPFIMHALDNFRVLLGMGADNKKSSLGTVAFQQIKQQRCIERVRTVVKSKRKITAAHPFAEDTISK